MKTFQPTLTQNCVSNAVVVRVLVAPSDILNASDNFVGDLMKSLTIITDFFALFTVFK